MSLTKFLEKSDVRARFRQEFPKPKMPKKPELLLPPQSQRYGLVGTAFDYLLRFHVQRLNPKAVNDRWIAEAAVSKLELQSKKRANSDFAEEGLSFPHDDSTLDLARSVVRRAKSNHKRYLQSGNITDPLLRSVIALAQLDTYFRSGFIDDDLGNAYREDIHDLRHLIDVADSIDFRAKSLCVLNPTFGAGSRLIRGADADLLIDGTLVEIKTTKSMELKREYFNQLLGYFAMWKIWGIDGLKTIPGITRIGIYFARHASMQVFETESLLPKSGSNDFLTWFKDSVERWSANS